MELLDIPFVQHVGIKCIDEETLVLNMAESVHNHLGTICTGAQYTLAETSSANLLKILYSDLDGSTLPVIRETNIRFRKPAPPRFEPGPLSTKQTPSPSGNATMPRAGG